jgi:hypothetical protein
MLPVGLPVGTAACCNSPESPNRRRECRLFRGERQSVEKISHQPGKVGSVQTAVAFPARNSVWIEQKVLRSFGLSARIAHISLRMVVGEICARITSTASAGAEGSRVPLNSAGIAQMTIQAG